MKPANSGIFDIKEIVQGLYWGQEFDVNLDLEAGETMADLSFDATLFVQDGTIVKIHVTVDTANKRILIYLNANETTELPYGDKHSWDLVVTDKALKPHYYIHGRATVVRRPS